MFLLRKSRLGRGWVHWSRGDVLAVLMGRVWTPLSVMLAIRNLHTKRRRWESVGVEVRLFLIILLTLTAGRMICIELSGGRPQSE